MFLNVLGRFQEPIMKMFETVKKDFVSTFIVGDRWQLYLKGLGVTLRIAFAAAILGVILGIILAFMKISKKSNGKRTIFSRIASIYIDIIRGTPVVVQLMILYFAILTFIQSKQVVAIIAFGLNSAAYVAEIVRSGILSIDPGQMEAGRAMGLSNRQTMQYIIIPQAFKNVLPALGNELIVLMKETAVVGYIGLQDLLKTGSYILTKTYRAFMPLIGSAIIYFVIIKIFSILLTKLERRLQRSDSN